jgi:hypothetical protein
MPSAGFPCPTCMTGTVLKTMSIGHVQQGFHWPIEHWGEEVWINVQKGYVKGRKFTSTVSLTDHDSTGSLVYGLAKHSPGHPMPAAVFRATRHTLQMTCCMIYTEHLVLKVVGSHISRQIKSFTMTALHLQN